MDNEILEKSYITEYIEFLESILRTSNLGIWRLDIQKEEIVWTEGFLQFLGLKSSRLKVSLNELKQMIHPEDYEDVLDNFNNILNKKNEEFHAKYRLINKDNQIIWIEARGKVVKDEKGNPTQIFGVIANITEKVYSEQVFESQAILIHEAGKIAKMGAWEIDVDTNSILLTSETYRIFEISEFAQIDLDFFLEIFQSSDQAIIKKKIDRSIFDGIPFDEEYLIFVNNKKKFIRIIGIPKKDKNRYTKIIGTIQDITENKLTQQSLIASEERFKIFYDLASEGICIFDKEFKILDVNPAFCLLFDIDSSLLLDSSLKNYFTPESFLSLEKYIEMGESFGDQIFLEGIRKDGKKIPFQSKFRTIYYNDEFVYIASFLDITFYQEAESLRRFNAEIAMQNELIKSQKKKLEETLENLKLTQEKLIISEKLASLGQLIAGIAHEINNPVGAISASNKNNEDILKTILEKFPIIVENFIQEKELIQLFLCFYYEYFEKKELPSTQEIRTRKKELFQIFRDHNLQNYLEVVEKLIDLGIYDFQEKYIPIYTSSEIFNFLYHLLCLNRNNNIIRIAHIRTSKIIYALRNYSRVNQSTSKTLVDIHENIETVLTLYHNQLKNSVQVTKEYGNVPKIYCYAEDLLQVWTNIIYNALQAMQFQGQLKIKTFQENQFVVVEIWDSGIGIPTHLMKKIFEPFFTTKPPGEGTGLGLDIVRRIIEKHSGKINLRSKPGETVFSFYLPIN